MRSGSDGTKEKATKCRVRTRSSYLFQLKVLCNWSDLRENVCACIPFMGLSSMKPLKSLLEGSSSSPARSDVRKGESSLREFL